MTNRKLLFLTGLFMLAVSGLFSFIVSSIRSDVEVKADKHISIVIDYEGFRDLAELTDYPFDKFLTELRKEGVTAVALKESNLKSLVERGEVFLVHPDEKSIKDGIIWVAEFRDPELAKEVFDKLTNKYNSLLKKTYLKGSSIYSSDEDLPSLYFGFLNKEINFCKKLGFDIVLRPINDYRFYSNKEDFERWVNQYPKNVWMIIFGERDVLGYQNFINIYAKILEKNNIRFGYVEFAKQRGIDELARMIPYQVLRVHAITNNEIPGANVIYSDSKFESGKKIKYSDAIPRWGRAIKERNIKVLYVNPWGEPLKGNLINTNLEYIKNIVQEIRLQGFVPGKALWNAHDEFYFKPIRLIWIFGIFFCLGCLLLLMFSVNLDTRKILIFSSVLLIINVLLFIFGKFNFIAWETALMSSTFPPIYLYNRIKTSSWISFLLNFIMVFLISILGALLTNNIYLSATSVIGINIFPLIKLLLVLPILLLGLRIFFRTINIKEYINELMKPMRRVEFAALIVFLIILTIYVLRSGNQNPIGLLPDEEHIRIFLEKTLFVRPRFKELIGYSMLIFSFYLYRLKNINFFKFFFLISSVAFISLTDTFLHIHIPIYISIIRCLEGLFLGSVLGFIFCFGLNILLKLYKTRFDK
ncbi:MAG TPA: hypothetical protein ENO30_06685 [Thermodesulfobium narugense]|nr:hypothetical protein [Thermodesulfobium narugense]